MPQSQPNSPSPVSDPLATLTIGQTAQLLACTERHVFHLVASGQLPSTRIGDGRGIRVRRVDLAAYLDARSGYQPNARHVAAMKRQYQERVERATERATKRAAKRRAS